MAQTERDFIIKFAIDKYNDQFGTKLAYGDFTVKSIPPNFNTHIGYELQTEQQLDFLRLRVYLLFGVTSILYEYKLENDTQTGHGNLLDEVFVTLGTLDSYYKEIFKFRELKEEDAWVDIILLTEDFKYIITEDGYPITFTE